MDPQLDQTSCSPLISRKNGIKLWSNFLIFIFRYSK